jgi:hypothetical protein
MRHPLNPEHYLLARSRSPEQIELGDIVEYTLEGEPLNDTRPPYSSASFHSRWHLCGAARHSRGGARA